MTDESTMRAILFALALVVPVSRASEPSAEQALELKRVAELLAGSFSSAEQAKQDSEFLQVQLRMVPIWTDLPGAHWLYVEQAVATALDRPYRQRIYKIEWGDHSPISRVFTLPGDALEYAGAWKDASPLAHLKPEQLTEREGCAIVLTKHEHGSYIGATVGKGCASDLRGASYATSEVVLSDTKLTTWDRGDDASGQQVWGATKGPYEFVKDRPERQ